MASWIIPGRRHDGPVAAITMRQTLREYNAGREQGSSLGIQFGIGIYSGPLMLGTIGENRRMESTVISDTVEALKNPEAFRVEFLAIGTVKGRIKPIEVFRVQERL